MAVEIEMKLAIKGANDSEVRAVLSELSADSGFQETLLINTYYDTSDHQLNKAKIALRIRRKDDCLIQTFKTKGKSINGMHRRGEWEWKLAENILDTSLLKDCEAWPDIIDVNTLDPVFETNFMRSVSKLRWCESEIELAYDLGKIIAVGAEREIRELELELISGKESGLLSLAQWLQERLELEADDISKAEKGYQLFSENQD